MWFSFFKHKSYNNCIYKHIDVCLLIYITEYKSVYSNFKYITLFIIGHIIQIYEKNLLYAKIEVDIKFFFFGKKINIKT